MFRKVCVFFMNAFFNVYFKVDVVNRERFEKLKGGCVVTPNHISAWETVIVPAKTKRVMYVLSSSRLPSENSIGPSAYNAGEKMAEVPFIWRAQIKAVAISRVRMHVMAAYTLNLRWASR